MKKILFAIIGLLLRGSELAFAEGYPVFSASLGGGAGSYGYRGVRRSMYRPGSYVGVGSGETQVVYGGVRAPASRPQKKIVLKYDPNQIELTEKQMETILPLIRRVQDGKVEHIDIISICRSHSAAAKRQTSLDQIFTAYNPNIKLNYRVISGAAVIAANDHTVELVEYR